MGRGRTDRRPEGRTARSPAQKKASRQPAAVRVPVDAAKEPAPPRQTGPPFPIVGVGASAGGVEALTQLFRALARDTGMAYVVIVHLDPTHESMLTEILARATRMPVVEVTDRMPVRPIAST